MRAWLRACFLFKAESKLLCACGVLSFRQQADQQHSWVEAGVRAREGARARKSLLILVTYLCGSSQLDSAAAELKCTKAEKSVCHGRDQIFLSDKR